MYLVRESFMDFYSHGFKLTYTLIISLSFSIFIMPVIYLQIRSVHSKYVKAQSRARTINVAPTAFELAPPRNGKLVDVALTAVSATMRFPSPNSFTYDSWGKNMKEGTYQMVTVWYLYLWLWQWQWHC